MKLIIAGGRNYRLTPTDFRRLDGIPGHIEEVVSGGCAGADTGGERWAAEWNIPVKRFKAKWNELGNKAGPLRNADMAAYADAVVLFPGGKGTESMFQEARKAGIEIYDWRKQ